MRELENTFVLDDSQAPLLIMRQVGELDDVGFQNYLNELGKRFITIPRVLLVFDMTHAKPASAKHRRMQAEWLQGMPYPHSVCATLEKAEAYCTDQLAQHGQTVPPRVRKL